MIPWTDIINKYGLRVCYISNDRQWHAGWLVQFTLGRFHIGMGVKPRVRADYELS